MWILPKPLHTSAFVPDTAALISDSNEQSQLCAQSLLVRSKPSPARTWSLKWKRDYWTRHLSGRILRHSHGQSFVTAWTSSLGDTHASPSVPPGSDSASRTPATSGPSSQTELDLCGPDSASLRTSKDISALDSEQSCPNWKASVIRRRGAYSVRLKSAHRTSASGCSSWPTASSRDWKDTPGMAQDAFDKSGKFRNRIDQLARSVYHSGHPAPANPSTDGSRQGLWQTPDVPNGGQSLPAGTSITGMTLDGNKKQVGLHNQVRAWSTPQAHDAIGRSDAQKEKHGTTHGCRCLVQDVKEANGKLNPRWVETLMGLPVGWTMPSCASPVTIAPTNCDCSATESCQR